MSVNHQVIVQSANKAIKKSNVTGKLDLKKLLLYTIIHKYIDFAENNSSYVTRRKELLKKSSDLKNLYPDVICNYKSVLPTTITHSTESVQEPISIEVEGANFTVTDIQFKPLFGSTGTEYDTYDFKKSDFEDVFSDNNNSKFHSIVIYRNDLQGGNLKYSESWISGTTYGESSIPIEILYDDIEKWSFYSDSTLIYSHSISYKIIDRVRGIDYESPTYLMTIDRSGKSGNLPATIGDTTVTVNSGVITPVTLAMVTSALTPPYNDPEGELLDAIRIVEISTANKGKLQLNGIDLIEGDIISREELEAELLTHVASSDTAIWADSFRFQARDEGSGQWVD